MSEIEVNCPHCGEPARAPAESVGKKADCPSCGRNFRIPSDVPSLPPVARASTAVPPPPMVHQEPLLKKKIEVVVTDFDMPFGSMVMFMIKWAIAAIPAFIVLAVLWFAVAATIMGGCASLMMRAK